MDNYEITFKPANCKVYASEGSTLKDAIVKSGLDFDFPCGGIGKCGKCVIKVLEPKLKVLKKEVEHFSENELSEGLHLACLTKIHSNMTVELNVKKNADYNILQSSLENDFTISPLFQKLFIQLDPPSLKHQTSDLNRLKEKLILKNSKYKNIKIGISTLRQMPDMIRRADNKITVIMDENEILGIESGDTHDKMLGIAFDIGTTTVVGYLMDLYTGRELAVSSLLNPQVKFGADVISRTAYASQNENGLKLLQTTILNALNKLINELCKKSNTKKDDIYILTVVGNTCMHHLFLGLTPKYIATVPFVPVINESIRLDASELKLNINPNGRVFALPTIAGFVGADTAAVILATDIDKSKDIKLAVDIGTNGEMVLGSSKKLVSCSAAAGPAFEGAQISSGMRGANGAIDHVYFRRELTYTVIGNEKPRGICGSGLLDIIAGFVKVGLVNKRGKLLSPDKFTNPSAKKYSDRIISYNNANAFLIVPESETFHGNPILVTQKDITSLQLAKGAISAGIKMLIKNLGINLDDIKEVLLAGAFGNYMDPHSACEIGLIPKELGSKIKLVGNAAGSGAKLALLSESEFKRANRIASKVTYVELGAQEHFNLEFARGMQF
ncbi:ASKHA domain-containing protein [uncultured Clostridium sp.]|uniref:ASKHA domain-containing protein n=1 Tax=uncultured Clostridium sp. TaxID=59620 RepID=UPI002600A7DB|nr:ASKHA domain-containing protein [uncultured Clostridium sp.]